MTATPAALLAAMQLVTRELHPYGVQVTSIKVHAPSSGAPEVDLHISDWGTFTTVAKVFGLDPATARYISPGNDKVTGHWSGMVVVIYGSADPAKTTTCHCHDRVAP